MSSLKKVLMTLAVAPVGACVTTGAEPPPQSPPGHNFSYRTEDREKLDLVQAFDDGARTYLQFNVPPSSEIEITRSASEQRLAYTPAQNYLVIQGVYDRLSVSEAGISTSIVNESANDPPPQSHDLPLPDPSTSSSRISTMIDTNTWTTDGNPNPDRSSGPAPQVMRAPAVGIPESLQTMNAKLRVAAPTQKSATLEERIHALTDRIDELHTAGRGTDIYVRSIGGLPRLVLTFDNHSDEVRLDEALLPSLGEAARAANRIYLHGHTDAYVASEAGTDLAVRRAVRVRQLLIALKADPTRIRLFYRGTGDFVANNLTAEGKALNRRVEIELRKW